MTHEPKTPTTRAAQAEDGSRINGWPILIDAGTMGVLSPTGGGHTNTYLRPDPAAFADPAGFAARFFKVTREQYRGWVETVGEARCGATTAKGAPCRNHVSGGVQLSIDAWLKADGGLCATHGGPRRSEVDARKREDRRDQSPEMIALRVKSRSYRANPARFRPETPLAFWRNHPTPSKHAPIRRAMDNAHYVAVGSRISRVSTSCG